MKRKRKIKIWSVYIIPLAIITFGTITQEQTVTTDGAYSRLYGFPLAFISEGWVTSFHHSVFIGPLILDFFSYLAFWAVFALSIQKFVPAVSIHNGLVISIWLLVSAFVVIQFILIAENNSYSWDFDMDFRVESRALWVGMYP